jgi:hypothetical protein
MRQRSCVEEGCRRKKIYSHVVQADEVKRAVIKPDTAPSAFCGRPRYKAAATFKLCKS